MYFKQNKKTLLMLAISLAVILLTSLLGSLIQTSGWSIQITDLRGETNKGVLYAADGSVVQYNAGTATEPNMKDVAVNGEVQSGLLYVPSDASATNKLPAIVLTHGYLNNRELQMPNAIELARRGFIVLAIDREGHGNYENEGTTGAMMATKGMYESVKYLYNLDIVDRTKIGISGHSMGGYTTAMTLYQDAYNPMSHSKGTGLGIVSAGLMQGWSTYIYSAPNVDVGMLKAKDDEFFFQSKDLQGNPTICREYLHSVGAAQFVKMDTTGLSEINVVDGGIYVNGQHVQTNQGTEVEGAFRVVYEADEIHPLNHFSTEATNYVVDFFYNAFGTPRGHNYIASGNQVWVLKELTATLGFAAVIFMIFPLLSLLLTLPFFAELKKRRLETEDGRIVYTDVVPEEEAKGAVELKGIQKHISYWAAGIACTLFAGFSIEPIQQWAGSVFPKTELFPQDTTGWVALWAVACGLFALAVILVINIVNRVVNYFLHKEEANENPFEVARIGSVSRWLKTLLLAVMVVTAMYLVLFSNWAVWTTDFRFWTFAMKVFDVEVMLPTMVRYMAFFGIFYVCNAIGNQGYRVRNLPEWATIAINAAFNIFGIALVFAIQYGTFCTTGVMWKPSMNLSYIVLFPIIPVLICATIISRITYKKTGSIWLGAFINTILWTMITVSGTASSIAYVFTA